MVEVHLTMRSTTFVIPANAGIPLAVDACEKSGTPAFAGATILEDRRG